MTFSHDMAKFSKSASLDLEDAVIGIKIDLFNGVIRDTRVGNSDYWKVKPKGIYVGGRLRGNWQTTTGSPATGVIDRKDTFYYHEDGGDAQSDVEKTVKPDTVDYLTNNLPYAEVYEEKDAMIEKGLTRINRIIKKQIRKL